MKRPKNLFANVIIILIASVLGAVLMVGFDMSGTRWLKFILYIVFFASILSPALFSSSFSCSILSRLRR